MSNSPKKRSKSPKKKVRNIQRKTSNSKKPVRMAKELADIYGSFNDLASFRAETGLSADDVPDIDALTVINSDMQEQKRIADQAQQRSHTAAQQNQFDRNEAASHRQKLENELHREKNTRQFYEKIVHPGSSYYTSDPLKSATQYLERQQLKREVREELERERREKIASRPLRRSSRSRSNSRKKKKVSKKSVTKRVNPKPKKKMKKPKKPKS
jgi:hypothetical protein